MEDFCLSIRNVISCTKIKVVSKRFFDISCNIPTDVDITVLGSQHGIKDAKKLGQYKSVKLEFWILLLNPRFSSMTPESGYEIFPVYKIKDLLKCCFKCRSLRPSAEILSQRSPSMCSLWRTVHINKRRAMHCRLCRLQPETPFL